MGEHKRVVPNSWGSYLEVKKQSRGTVLPVLKTLVKIGGCIFFGQGILLGDVCLYEMWRGGGR